MTARDILVHLKSHEEWSPHIDHAIGVAVAFGAKLRGLVTFPQAAMMKSLGRFPATMVAEQVAIDKKFAAALEGKFAAACKASGVEFTFSIGEGPAGEIVPWAARLHDLTIIEQRDTALDELGYDAAEETVLSSGRPVLVVPRAGRYVPAPERILIAWNGSQQSAAAVQGAMPFIARARHVKICSGELKLPLRSTIVVPKINIDDHIRSHGPEVTHEIVTVSASDVGAHLLRRANDLGCGMIVMGAYGRSWFSEFVLGGATRHMLKHLTVPVLMGR